VTEGEEELRRLQLKIEEAERMIAEDEEWLK